MKKIFFIIFYTFILLHFYTFVVHAQTFSCTFDSSNETCKSTTTCPSGYTPNFGPTELYACNVKCNDGADGNVKICTKGSGTCDKFTLPCTKKEPLIFNPAKPDSQTSISPTSSAPPTSSTNKDCTEDGGVCRLQSLGCSTGFRGQTSSECKSQNSGGLTYQCCMPQANSSTAGYTDSGQIDPGGYTSLSDSQCVGRGLADYMNAVIAGAGNIPNVRLLSPAFNMTSATFDGIVNSMGQNGAKFGELDGIAGNVYNVENRRITSWLTEKLANPYVSGKPVFITETGEKDFADGKIGLDEAKTRLKPELDALRTVGNQWNVQAVLLFNGLGANSGFSSFQWSDNGLRELCGGYSCGPVGINQASFFSQSDTRYSIMRDLNMLYDLEIATSGNVDAVIRAVNALPNGSIIVRVGVGDDSGGFSDPQKYVDFIKAVAGKTTKTVYFIAGPNEPDSEFWADPQCKTNTLPAKKGPLEEGFNPQNSNLGCDKTKDPEYNPLRPYPGNPCDPLIPRSVPEAPVASEKKFNTFACGASLTPQREEVFDPYGKNGLYEGLPGPEGYAHTVCEPLTDNVKKNGGLVTCWRSSAFDITVDLSRANLGILGNTQDTSLTDTQKVNEYLSWYLTGTPQIGDQLPSQIDRLVNFSGPLRKLLPFDLAIALKETLAKTVSKDVHDYTVSEQGTWLRVFKNVDSLPVYLQKIIQNVPLSSMEDTAGEYTMSVFRDSSNDQQMEGLGDQVYSSVVNKNTAPLQLIIKSAQLAK